MNLSSTIKSIQDIMRKDDGVDGDAQRLGQLTWMLFLKVFDQREEEWEDDNASYRSPLPEHFRWRNWAAYVAGPDGKKAPQKSPSDIISFVNNELFPGLKELDANLSPQHKVIRSVFEDANNYMKSGTQLLAVIEKLEDAINFHDFKTRASLGDVYEQMLNDLRGAGNAGEFYTPRAITQFMVDRIDPRLDKREKVIDPACGTGGFLTAAIDHFRHQREKAEDEHAIQTLIHGIEKKQLPHLLCTTNMLLHGIDVPSQIEHKNTLAIGWNDWNANDRVDCVITNPPFGGYEDDNVASGYHHPTKETADLFMQLIVKLLRENGRAAVVLPDGFLFGDGIKAEIKKRLMQQCKLHTIVRLPKGVFAPYTTIKTNLLFFTKGPFIDDGSEHFHTDSIWFYEHPYPAGYKSYSKTKPIRFEEFKPEQDWWGTADNDFADRVENEFAWKIDFSAKRQQAEAAAQPHWQRAEQLNNQASGLENQARDLAKSLVGSTDSAYRGQINAQIAALREQVEPLRLQARDAQAAGDRLYWPIYNLDVPNPNKPQEESHDPDLLLEKYKTLLGEIEETENNLKSELAAALAHHFTAEQVE
ncbi:type I restriction-modification system subunit M [Methylicorpusculum sp.]|uniref:type I restriction-modification system subunit M n=1 Tax=Methylicorpusculum sp. TaxID=2713644 RepID=UPI002731570B|nr:type I restriction-modification system subunit M [Methylicorpusculum sp.]MDP2178077.1 N-6 DNA methylase [Methylicorpusculum sp.]MDP3529029.1 N-6 DNA methylase [Methylicorpusculum sp.]MDZ4153712.1 N-6 DNA methylase [Methylicorpusculum sp.]